MAAVGASCCDARSAQDLHSDMHHTDTLSGIVYCCGNCVDHGRIALETDL